MKLPYALILAPTRELSCQIAETVEALGSAVGVRTAVLVGGMDMTKQTIALSRRPHVVVGTPGRVVDHLTNTKGFVLQNCRHLVLDEADRLLHMDFEKEIIDILAHLPVSGQGKGRQTQMFSATMTRKVEKLKRASLSDPVRLDINEKFKTVETLQQH